VVFLHDSLGCVETWRDFPQRLSERTGLDALIYDRRGYGQSSPFSGEARTVRYLHQEAELLFLLLDTLAIERVVLFGHSDGGSISLIAAAQRPLRIEAVITEGAHVFVEEVTLAGIRHARTLLASTDLGRRLESYHGAKAGAVAAAWIDTWLSPEFRDWNIESCLPRIVCPVLAIQGSEDEYGTPAQVMAIVAGIGPRARPLFVPGVGHTPHRDAAGAVLDASAGFLAENSAR
jgi:pimeloyl-ACP methyl ester carboxylesterase